MTAITPGTANNRRPTGEPARLRQEPAAFTVSERLQALSGADLRRLIEMLTESASEHERDR